jgi:hypothetical protein
VVDKVLNTEKHDERNDRVIQTAPGVVEESAEEGESGRIRGHTTGIAYLGCLPSIGTWPLGLVEGGLGRGCGCLWWACRRPAAAPWNILPHSSAQERNYKLLQMEEEKTSTGCSHKEWKREAQDP